MRKESVKTVMPQGNFPELAQPEPGETGTKSGGREALDQLFSVTYEELRRLANSVKRGDPGMTLSPTALVNEAWLKLAKSPSVSAASRMHFKRIAARAMRQL